MNASVKSVEKLLSTEICTYQYESENIGKRKWRERRKLRRSKWKGGGGREDLKKNKIKENANKQENRKHE